MLTDEQLQEIEARCEAATSGPWETDYKKRYVFTLPDDSQKMVAELRISGGEISDVKVACNAVFFAHTRQDVPSLLAHIRELEAEKAHRERALYFQSSRMVKHFRENMLCCSDKQCADDGGCIECLTAQALAATKESPCPT